MSALTIPSRLPIHSLLTGTSLCSTLTTSTSSGGGPLAATSLFEHPNVAHKHEISRQYVKQMPPLIINGAPSQETRRCFFDATRWKLGSDSRINIAETNRLLTG